MIGRYHAHPAMIFQQLWRFLYLLLLPVLRGVLSALQNGLAGWQEGAWFDLFILVCILFLASLRWWGLALELRPNGLFIAAGLIWRTQNFIPMEHIDTLMVTRPFYLKPLGAVILRADTKAGSFDKPDLRVPLWRADAQAIFSQREACCAAGGGLAREYRPRGIYIAALSAILSNSLAGVIFFATFITQTGNLLGEEFENRIFGTFERFTRMMAFGIPPAAAALAYLMLFGWLYTFLRNLIRHKSFCARRQGDSLKISGGLFTNRCYSISAAQINYVDIRQSVLTKLLGLHSVFIHAVGYGKLKDDVSALIPAAGSRDLARHLGLLLPEFRPSPRRLKPNPGAIFRFLNDAFWPCLLLPIAACLLVRFFPDWAEFISWVGFMSCLPCYLFLLVRILDFSSSGIGRRHDAYTLRYSSGFYLHTIIIPRNKVATITLRQSIFQKMDNKCDILLYSIAEKRTRHHIRNLDKTMVLQVLDIQLMEPV